MVKMEWVRMVTKRTPRPRLFSFSFNAFPLLSRRSSPLFRYPTTLESISPLLVFSLLVPDLSFTPLFSFFPFFAVFHSLNVLRLFVPLELAVLTPFDRVR